MRQHPGRRRTGGCRAPRVPSGSYYTRFPTPLPTKILMTTVNFQCCRAGRRSLLLTGAASCNVSTSDHRDRRRRFIPNVLIFAIWNKFLFLLVQILKFGINITLFFIPDVVKRAIWNKFLFL